MAGAKVSGGPVAVVFVRTTGTVFPNGCVHSPPPACCMEALLNPPPLPQECCLGQRQNSQVLDRISCPRMVSHTNIQVVAQT